MCARGSVRDAAVPTYQPDAMSQGSAHSDRGGSPGGEEPGRGQQDARERARSRSPPGERARERSRSPQARRAAESDGARSTVVYGEDGQPEENEAAMRRRMASLEARLARMQKSVRRQLEKEYEAKVAATRESIQRELKEAYEREFNVAVQEARRRAIETAHAEVGPVYEDRLKRETERVTEELQRTMDGRLKDELARIRSAQAGEVARLMREIDAATERGAAQVEALRKQAADEIAKINSSKNAAENVAGARQAALLEKDAELRAAVSAREAVTSAHERLRNTWNDELEKLREELARRDAEFAAARAGADGEVAALRRRVEEAERAAASAATAVANAGEKEKQMKAEMGRLMNRTNETEKKLREKDAEIADLARSTNAEMERRLEEERKARAELQVQFEGQRKQLEDAIAAADSAKFAFQASSRAEEGARRALGEQKAEVHRLTERIKAEEAARESQKQETGRLVASLEAKIKRLTDMRTADEEARRQQMEQNGRLVADLEGKIAAAGRQVQAANAAALVPYAPRGAQGQGDNAAVQPADQRFPGQLIVQVAGAAVPIPSAPVGPGQSYLPHSDASIIPPLPPPQRTRAMDTQTMRIIGALHSFNLRVGYTWPPSTDQLYGRSTA